MVAHGMMDEVTRLLDAGYGEHAAGMATIGYRQFAAVAGPARSDEAMRLTRPGHRALRKRQMTWFARDAEIRWLDVDAAGGVEGVAEQVAKWAVEEELIGRATENERCWARCGSRSSGGTRWRSRWTSWAGSPNRPAPRSWGG